MKALLKFFFFVFFVVIFLRACTPFLTGKSPLIGKPAPEFRLRSLNGEWMPLSEIRQGQPALIFFWSTWCPHCRTQLRDLARQHSDIEDSGFKIIAVDVEETFGTIKKYVQAHNIPLDIYLDEDGSVSRDYRIVGVPTYFFVNEEGIVVAVEHYLPDNYEDILTGVGT